MRSSGPDFAASRRALSASITVAELWFGAGRGLADFAVVTFEHGVGMGFVMNHRLYRGARYTEATKTLQVPLPESGPTSRSPLSGVGRGGAAPFDGDIIAWVGGVFTALLEPDEVPAS